MLKITLDTNILISGTFWTGPSFRILDLIDKWKITLILSEEILFEYKRIIKSTEIMEKVDNKDLILFEASKRIIINSLIVKPSIKLDVVKDDPDDNIILECANAGKADYIVTNDKHILKIKVFEGIKILTPSEFLRVLKLWIWENYFNYFGIFYYGALKKPPQISTQPFLKVELWTKMLWLK